MTRVDPQLDLGGRIGLVTGARQGIGRHVARLLAQRCGTSGVVTFPRRARSVHCGTDELVDTTLSVEAELWSWTVADVGFPDMLAQARFPEGPVVQGYLQGDPARPPEIGATVEVVPHVVPLPPKGEATATTYAFRVKEGTS